jgi:hypothetical protein
MSKLFIIEANEKEKILNLHKKEKRINHVITEQKTRSEAIKFFTDAKEAGCLIDPNLDFSNIFKKTGESRVYIKGTSKTGNVKRVYDDSTWEVVNPKGEKIMSGPWKCDQVAQNVADNSSKLQEYKNQGYQEYKDVVLKTKIDDPKFYETIDFKGVQNNKLYKPLYTKNEVGKIENWPKDSEQVKILTQLTNDGYIINPSQADLMTGNLEEYTPPIDLSLFPNGPKVYRDITKLPKATGSQQTIQQSIVGAQDCENNVKLYWESYKNGIPPKGTNFENMKNIVQACANQNMYRWKGIGGVLGVGGGSRHLDNILEVMINKELEYENVRQPGNGTPWALVSPRIQKR